MYDAYIIQFPHHHLLTGTQILGTWIAALLTLAIFSFLYKDNPIYRFAEHLFVGVSAGFQFVYLYEQYLKVKMIDPLTDWLREYYHLMTWAEAAMPRELVEWKLKVGLIKVSLYYIGIATIYYIIPSLMGLLILARMFKGVEWMSKYPIAFYVGYGAGLSITIMIHANILEQLASSIQSLPDLYNQSGFLLVSYLLFVVGLLCSLLYFYFSASQRGPIMQNATRMGVFVLMITFGAQFGFTIMARISLLISRMQFLMGDWLGLIK